MLKILLIIFLIALIISMAVGYVVFKGVFDYGNNKDENPDPDPNYVDSDKDAMRPTAKRLYEYQKPLIEKMRTFPFKKLEVESFDHLKLKGFLLEGNPKEVVICIHGFKSNMENDYCDKIKIYMDRGTTVLLAHDRAHGESEGRYLGFSELDRFDVESWVNKVNEMYDNPRIYLHGVSMGGATVVHCANMHLKNVVGIIDDCGFDSIENITKALMKDTYHLPYFPFGDFAWFWSVIIAHVSFNTSVGEKIVKETDVPILFIHGKQDHFVPPYMSERMYEACVSPKELLLVDDCGHAAAYMMNTEGYTAAVNRLMNGEFK